MNMTTFLSFVLLLALAIWGRRLREKAFRALSAEQKVQVADKMPNYTSTEMIPFAGLFLGLVAILLFRPGWLRAAFAIFLPLLVLLVTVLHLRTRHRFRNLGLPASFLSQYENSRIVTYSALVVPFAVFAWVLFR